MSMVSFSGLATGMDTASLVSQLIELKRAPIYRLQRQRSSYENQVAALGSLKTKLMALQAEVLSAEVPAHVGVIMDGNGRWAQQQGLPRIEGHRRGAAVAREQLARRGDGLFILLLVLRFLLRFPGGGIPLLLFFLQICF